MSKPVSFSLFLLSAFLIGVQLNDVFFAFSLAIVTVFSLAQCRRDPYLFPLVFFISYCIYSFIVGRFLLGEIVPINHIIGDEYDRYSILILYVFFGVFYLFVSYGVDRSSFFSKDSSSFLDVSVKTGVWYALFAIALLSLGVILQLLSSGGESAIEGRSGYSPMYEYATVPYLFSLYFSRGAGRFVKIVVILGLLFAILRDFYLGHRVTGLQIGLLLYVFYFYRFYTFNRFVLAFLVSVIAIAFVAVLRGGSGIGVLGTLTNLAGNGFSFDTAYYAYVASLTFVAVHDLHGISVIVDNALGYLLLLVFGSGSAKDLYSITKEYYQHSNGGVLPFYLYYYTGWFGVVGSALLVSFFYRLRMYFDKKSGMGFFSTITFAYFFCTVPRWFLYSPQPLLRGAIITFILAILVYMVARLFRAKVNNLHL